MNVEEKIGRLTRERGDEISDLQDKLADAQAEIERLKEEVDFFKNEYKLWAEKLEEKDGEIRFLKDLDAVHAEEAKVETERLREAIRAHRENIWGDGGVGHDEDVALYEKAVEL